MTYAADGDILCTRLHEELGNDTLLLELKVHLGLVGLNLYQDITRADGVSGLLLPGANVASLHGWRQGGHLDDLMAGERGIAPHDMRCESGSQSMLGRGEDSPPKSGAEHCRRRENSSRCKDVAD